MAVDKLREGKSTRCTCPILSLPDQWERALANRYGTLTTRYIDYLVERARGDAGFIQVESTYVDPGGMGHVYQVGCHGDHVIPALARMAEAVQGAGAKVALELYFGGRPTSPSMSQRQAIGPSVVKCGKLTPVPTPHAMTEQDIQEIMENFAQAARRVVEAGLDMIHPQGSDDYGGALENRARFPLEVLAAVCRVWVKQDDRGVSGCHSPQNKSFAAPH